jgi:hypothetical protein
MGHSRKCRLGRVVRLEGREASTTLMMLPSHLIRRPDARCLAAHLLKQPASIPREWYVLAAGTQGNFLACTCAVT